MFEAISCSILEQMKQKEKRKVKGRGKWRGSRVGSCGIGVIFSHNMEQIMEQKKSLGE